MPNNSIPVVITTLILLATIVLIPQTIEFNGETPDTPIIGFIEPINFAKADTLLLSTETPVKGIFGGKIVGLAPESIYDKESIEAYLRIKAEQNNLNPDLVVCIAKAESGNFDPKVLSGKVDGDRHLTCKKTGKPIRSKGIFQWNDCVHNISDEVAYDIEKSTELAIPELQKNPQIWSTYAKCKNLTSAKSAK